MGDSPGNSPAIFMRGGELWLMNYCWPTPKYRNWYVQHGIQLRAARVHTPVIDGSHHGGVGSHLVRSMARCLSRINIGGRAQALRHGAAPLWCKEGAGLATRPHVPVHTRQPTTLSETVSEEHAWMSRRPQPQSTVSTCPCGGRCCGYWGSTLLASPPARSRRSWGSPPP